MIPTSDRRAFVRRLLAWGRAHQRSFPWRETKDPLRILVAELLLQRSRAATVAKVYDRLFGRWPDAATLAGATERSIAAVIRPIGLTGRARTIKRLAGEVAARGDVPRSVSELLDLPGVGRYVAHATVAVAFGRRVPTVDGVSARVYRRYFGLPAERSAVDDPDLWRVVEQVTPTRAVREWNWAVLDLAASVCLPKVPRCPDCPLRDRCAWSQSGSSHGGKISRS